MSAARTRHQPSAIERESYRILRSRLDLSHLAPLSRAVAERVVHASADLAYASDLVLDEAALRAGWEALAGGAPVVVDGRMVAAGITGHEVHVALADDDVSACAGRWGTTRAAAAMRLAARRTGPGAVWVVANAPTALTELLAHPVAPALVVGLPVGFVGAVEAKAALREQGWPALTNRSEKGGSAVAAAAVNALLYTSAPGERT